MQMYSRMKTTPREVLYKSRSDDFCAYSALVIHLLGIVMFSCGLYWHDEETNKSALARHLETQVSPAYVIFKPSACIIDAMALLHKIRVEKKTFGYLTEIIINLKGWHTQCSDGIDIIFDVLKDINS